MTEETLELFTVGFESRGGDGPYGWGNDAYTVMLGERSVDMYRTEIAAKGRVAELNSAARARMAQLESLATHECNCVKCELKRDGLWK